METFRNIYILGAHKLAYSYFKDIKKAMQEGSIACEKLVMIDPNPENPGVIEQANSVIQETPYEFLFKYLDDPNNLHPQDSLVPDHTAKHVMLQLFLHFVKTKFKNKTTAPKKIELNLETPFTYKSDEDSILALSYATWTCPADCPEPADCPHIEAKRTWDLNTALQTAFNEYERQNPESKTYQFFCRTFVKQISHIPMTEIMSQFSDFSYRLQNNQIKAALIGTNSHCHGIVGGFKIN